MSNDNLRVSVASFPEVRRYLQRLQAKTLAKMSADYVRIDGTRELTADWDAGSHKITAEQLAADIADGTTPMVVTSTTVVANLNVDQVDGKDSTDLVLRDGSQSLLGAWDAGSYGITAETFTSDVATGTAPFTVASTTVVANLNADLLDGAERTAFTENADFNAKGDILSASANDTPLILTVGTNDYVLTAASGEATGLKWAEASGGKPCLLSGGYVTRSGTDLLYKPDVSDKVYLYENSLWVEKVIADAGITVACTGLSASTAHYLYVYDNAGTLTLDLSETASTTQDGIGVKTGATDRLLVALCYADAAGAITTYAEDAATQLVNNVFNKRKIFLYKKESTNSWTYNSATWRPANASTLNRLSLVCDGKNFVTSHVELYTSRSANGDSVLPGVALDATNTSDTQSLMLMINSVSVNGPVANHYVGNPAAGYHFLQWTERAAVGGVAVSVYGDFGIAVIQSTIFGEMLA